MVTIVNLPASATRSMRQQLLRPHQTLEQMAYEGDNAPSTRHFCAFDDQGRHVGIVSIYLQTSATGDVGWQLRAMATTPEVRGQGYGRKLIAAAEHYALSNDKRRGVTETYIWANARAHAVGFYSRQGYVAQGEPFEVPDIGPHVFMSKRISNASKQPKVYVGQNEGAERAS